SARRCHSSGVVRQNSVSTQTSWFCWVKTLESSWRRWPPTSTCPASSAPCSSVAFTNRKSSHHLPRPLYRFSSCMAAPTPNRPLHRRRTIGNVGGLLGAGGGG